MIRRVNIWSFYLCIINLILSISLIYSIWHSTWVVTPPSYILWLFAVIAFISSIWGLKDNTSRLSRYRSWFTIIVSLLLSLILFLGVLRPLIVSEELITTTHSPDNSYTIHFFLTNGGATTSFGVIGKLDGPLWFTKTIYNEYRIDQANVEWINIHTISINNRELDIKKGETFPE